VAFNLVDVATTPRQCHDSDKAIKRRKINELVVADKGTDWHRLKAPVLDSVSFPIAKRVYNLGLDEFFAWYGQERRPGFTKATVCAWRVALEARGLGGPCPST
jgi:hypothetical protein